MSEDNFDFYQTEQKSDISHNESDAQNNDAGQRTEPQESYAEQRSYYQQNDAIKQGSYQQDDYIKQDRYQQQNYYQQNTYPSMYQEPQQESQAFGIASMILGIMSLVLFCSCLNIPLAVMAIIFAIIQIVKPGKKKGMAIAGIITSVLSIFLFIIMIITFLLSTDFRELEQEIGNGLGEEFYYNYTFPDHHDNPTF